MTATLTIGATIALGVQRRITAQTLSMTVEQARKATLDKSMILVDIRTPDEWKESGVPDVSTALDMTQKGFVQDLLALRKNNPDVQLGLICATGGRSSYVAGWLRRNGITGVIDIPAGMHTRQGWLARSLPVRKVSDK